LKADFHLVPLTKRPLAFKGRQEIHQDRLLNKNYNYLTRWLNPKLQIDYQGAITRLKQLREHDEESFQEEAAFYKQKGKQRSLPMERYNMRKYNLELFAQGIFNPKVDRTVKRFHSTLTSLKSELRQYITYDDQRLVPSQL